MGISYRNLFASKSPSWCRLGLLFLLAALCLGNRPAAADNVTRDMEQVTPFSLDVDVRDLPAVPSTPPYIRPLRAPPSRPKTPTAGIAPEEPVPSAPLAPMPSATQSFPGITFSDPCTGGQCGAGWPPDINGDVGLNHYIVAVNDAYAIYDKSGTRLASFTENQLWVGGSSNPCNGNSRGDPVVLFDRLANRWILTHFAFAFSGGTPVSPFYQCIAASKTADPVSGGWWLYALRMDPGGAGLPPVGALNDYPKFGIWTDCVYMGVNEFQGNPFIGTAYASFSRSDLYAGAPLTWALGFINNASDPFTLIPSNLSGKSLPPVGTPNYVVSESGTAFAYEVRKFTPGTNCGAGTLGAPTNVSQASYTSPAGNIVPQPGTTNNLDAIDDRLMQKVQYRRVGTKEYLWVAHPAGNSPVRFQWSQLDVTGGTVSTTPTQQQIFAPDLSLNRWMPSIAADKQGNAAVGYSTSNGTAPNYPSISYAGRLAGDPLNTLPQTEVQLIAGAGSQTNNCGGAPCHRWGDYTAMAVDPTNDCTFWYTNEYYDSLASGTSGNWHTRVGAFTFPSCKPPPLICCGDFNGDRKSDILWRYTSGQVNDWLLNGTGVIGGGLVGTVPNDWQIVGVGDFNGDGKSDILWRNTSGEVVEWLLNGTSVIGGGSLGTVANDWQIAGVGDFNGDGKSDFLWRNTSGEVVIWLMNGTSVIGGGSLGTVSNDWQIVGVGDFNGDGKSDILWRNASGEAVIWEMNGTSVIGGGSLGTVTNDWQIAGVGDFNGDGKSDFLWRNTSGEVVVWLLNGTSVIGGGSLGTVVNNWQIAGVGDFNGDGKSDILWRYISGEVSEWLMSGTSVIGGGTLGTVTTDWQIE